MADNHINSDKALFANNVFSTLFGGELRVMPQFYLTHYCNLMCSGCYMASGSYRAQTKIPICDVNFYMREFAKLSDSDADKKVVFSGGEIFTLPVEYLRRNIQGALDLGFATQLKTNGMWVKDTRRGGEVFKMLRGIKASAPLGMVVSVDDKIHPASCADCFVDIAMRFAQDEALARNVSLKSFSFVESRSFFDSRVIGNPQVVISDFHELSEYGVQYRIGNVAIESFFGDFIDTAAPQSALAASDIALPGADDVPTVVFFFHPDGTVGFENAALQSVGRVPYVDKFGKYKSVEQLVNDMAVKMISDYAR